jgi:trans-2,3-dihydro-3-hydroxyanthranilate isomerase
MTRRRSSGRPWYWLDVFTAQPLAGNGLAVVLDADGLDPETMLAFAREVGLSETTFVQTADDDRADYLNRIWTISGEIPFAGHPSLGTAVAVALHASSGGSPEHSSGSGSHEHASSGGPSEHASSDGPSEHASSGGSPEPGTEFRFLQQTGAGVQEVMASCAEDGWQASVHQEKAVFGRTFGRDEVARSLGLGAAQMDPELSCQIASTGLPALLAPVADIAALESCRPDFNALRELEDNSALNLYAFAYERGSRTIRARCFGADLAGIEDPATGSAAGPLVAYLQDCLDISRITVEQGVEMGRPSTIEARIEAGRPLVSGRVAVLAAGQVHLPEA